MSRASFLVDVRPRAAAFSRDGKGAYVTNEISGTLSVIDVAKHEVIETIELGRGEGKPVGVVASPDGTRVYVANGTASAVSVIDARTLRVTGLRDAEAVLLAELGHVTLADRARDLPHASARRPPS